MDVQGAFYKKRQLEKLRKSVGDSIFNQFLELNTAELATADKICQQMLWDVINI